MNFRFECVRVVYRVLPLAMVEGMIVVGVVVVVVAAAAVELAQYIAPRAHPLNVDCVACDFGHARHDDAVDG